MPDFEEMRNAMNRATQDDIVTRLRKACQYEDGYQLTMAPELVSAIADEIERLRNALAEQTIIHEVQKTNTLNEVERLRTELAHTKQQLEYERSMEFD